MATPATARPAGRPAGRPGSNLRWPVLGAAAAGVVAVVGLGGWGAFALLSGGGAQPADAIPSTAFAYLSLDLDPSASQKIEAFKILNKFPALKEELDLSSADDLRRVVFDEMQSSGTCKNLDYDQDVRPWIGDRIALAVVPSEGEPGATPLLALQVSDQDAAAVGVTSLAKCSDAGEDFGFAFNGDYVLVTDSTKRAEGLVAAAAEGSLADDADFTKWTEEAGDPGIVTMYAAPDAPRFLMDIQQDMMGDGSSDEAAGPMGARMRALYQDFEGMAVAIRVDDGAVEAEFAGHGLPTGIAATEGEAEPSITELPASTAAAFSVALPDGWLASYLEQIAGVLSSGESVDEMLAEAEVESGLDLPEDIETLFGDGVSLSVNSDFDVDTMFGSEDISGLPIGIRVSGDPDEILGVFEKVKRAFGPDGDMLIGAAGDGQVVFGVNQEYVDSLLAGGSLGDLESFRRVVASADDASGVLFVNFDAGDGWLERAAESAAGFSDTNVGGTAGDTSEPEDDPAKNLAPLDALGVSTWADGDIQRGLFRLTTD